MVLVLRHGKQLEAFCGEGKADVPQILQSSAYVLFFVGPSLIRSIKAMFENCCVKCSCQGQFNTHQ